jgi:hypothetical protein
MACPRRSLDALPPRSVDQYEDIGSCRSRHRPLSGVRILPTRPPAGWGNDGTILGSRDGGISGERQRGSICCRSPTECRCASRGAEGHHRPDRPRSAMMRPGQGRVSGRRSFSQAKSRPKPQSRALPDTVICTADGNIRIQDLERCCASSQRPCFDAAITVTNGDT